MIEIYEKLWLVVYKINVQILSNMIDWRSVICEGDNRKKKHLVKGIATVTQSKKWICASLLVQYFWNKNTNKQLNRHTHR